MTAMSRRNFLTGAILAGGAATLGIAGCAPKTAGSAETTETTEAEVDAKAVSPTGAGSANEFATALVTGEEPVPDETIETDVVIVGGGASGLCAAVAAAQAGARVVLLEKQAQLGGNGMMPEGMFALGSPLQKAASSDLPSKLSIIANELQFTNFRINWDYWSNFIDGSGESIAWLMDLGVEFDRVGSMFNSPDVFHFGKDGHCEQFIETLIASVNTLGVDVRLETPCVALKSEDGGVTGAYGRAKDGRIVFVSAAAVCLMSGGFAGDASKVAEYMGYDTTYMQTPPAAANVGDGLALATFAGAADAPKSCLTASRSVGDVRGSDLFVVSAGQPYLWLNEMGHRYVWEDIGMQSMTLVVRANMAQKKCYSIFDGTELERLTTEGAFVKRYRTLAFTPLEDLKSELETALAIGPDENGVRTAYCADTIEELAEQMGIDPVEARKSVDRYNELCEKGVDDDFGKNSQYLVPVKTPPFYGFRGTLECQTSIGGIDIDPANRVVTPAGEPIGGLWAGGSDAWKLSMETYNVEVPGSLLGYCVYSGRTSGKAAAEYALSK